MKIVFCIAFLMIIYTVASNKTEGGNIDLTYDGSKLKTPLQQIVSNKKPESKFKMRELQYNFQILQEKKDKDLYEIEFRSTNLIQQPCKVYLERAYKEYKYIKLISSDLKFKFNDKTYEKLIKIDDVNVDSFLITIKSVHDYTLSCIAFEEPVKKKTIYLLLTPEEVESKTQLVLSNGKYEKVPDVYGYFLYADYYKKTENIFFRALPIKQKFDILEEIKAVLFTSQKEQKLFLEQTVNVIMQNSRTVQQIQFDRRSQSNKISYLKHQNVFFVVIKNLLHILYFEHSKNSFYFFLNKSLLFFDANRNSIIQKAQNIDFYILQSDFQKRQQLTQSLFDTKEQQIFEIGSIQYPNLPLILYTQIISQKNPQDIFNIAVLIFVKNRPNQLGQWLNFTNGPKLFCYEYYDNVIKPTKNLFLVEDIFHDDRSDEIRKKQLDIKGHYEYDSEQRYLIYMVTQDINYDSDQEKNNIIYKANSPKDIQSMKLNTQCHIKTFANQKLTVTQMGLSFIEAANDYQLACGITFCQNLSFLISPQIALGNYALSINLQVKPDENSEYIQFN